MNKSFASTITRALLPLGGSSTFLTEPAWIYGYTISIGDTIFRGGWTLTDKDSNPISTHKFSGRSSIIMSIPFLAENGLRFENDSFVFGELDITVFSSQPGS